MGRHKTPVILRRLANLQYFQHLPPPNERIGRLVFPFDKTNQTANMCRARIAVALLCRLAYGQRVSGEPYSIVITGACSDNNDINDVYSPMNTTSDGRWFYRGQGHGLYVYFDPDCDGPGGSASSVDAWLIDIDEPSMTATSDLDGDGECLNAGDGFNARINDDGATPPAGVQSWKVWCGSSLINTDLTIVLVDAPTLSPTTTCVDSDDGTTDPYGDGCELYVIAWCGVYDDSDFSSNAMCCLCGGGSSSTDASSIPTVSSPPSITPSPTTTHDVLTFAQMRAAINSFPGAWINVIAASIACASTLVVSEHTFYISGDAVENGAVLDGGGSVRMFYVWNGGRLVLDHVQLTNGFNAHGGAIFISGAGTELILHSCTMLTNTATVSNAELTFHAKSETR